MRVWPVVNCSGYLTCHTCLCFDSFFCDCQCVLVLELLCVFFFPAFECTAPALTGYVVTESDLTALSFDVTIACAAGYEGTAAVTGCSATGNTASAYSVSGCTGMHLSHACNTCQMMRIYVLVFFRA